VTLIESLIAILIFSMGILALVGMYSSAVSRTTDSQYRIEAANHANRILGQIWANVDRSTAANLTRVTHRVPATNPGGADCAFSGRRIGNAGSHGVGRRVTAAGTGLPGAKRHHQSDPRRHGNFKPGHGDDLLGARRATRTRTATSWSTNIN